VAFGCLLDRSEVTRRTSRTGLRRGNHILAAVTAAVAMASETEPGWNVTHELLHLSKRAG
jgi:hypothetical protein